MGENGTPSESVLSDARRGKRRKRRKNFLSERDFFSLCRSPSSYLSATKVRPFTGIFLLFYVSNVH